MTTVYFIRHAEPNYDNHNDALRELSAKGLADRKLVTRFLAGQRIDAVLSSPYKRAVDTLKDFADSFGFQMELVDDFRERKIDSVWIDNFQEFSKRQWQDFGFRLPDGECLRQVQERNIKALNGVLERYSGKKIAVGSHGTALSTIIHYYNPAFSYDDFEKIRKLMPWIVRFEFDEDKNCTEIQYIDLFVSPGCSDGFSPAPF